MKQGRRTAVGGPAGDALRIGRTSACTGGTARRRSPESTVLRTGRRTAALLLAGMLLVGAIPLPVSAQETAQEETLEDRVQQEKEYLLEALDRLEEMGLSPIAIWAKLTNDETVTDRIRTLTQNVSEAAAEGAAALGETLSDAALEAGSSAAEEIVGEISEAAQEQTEQVKEGIIEQIRNWLNGLLDNLL